MQRPIASSDIQLELIREAVWARRKLILPNTTCLIGESDLVTVTDADFAWEYEIKISRSDFFADFKKSYRVYQPYDPVTDSFPDREVEKHKLLTGEAKHKNWNIPRRFYFAVPADLVKASEVPDYCGLIYAYHIGTDLRTKVVREAPNLDHAGKLSEKTLAIIKRNVIFRYHRLLLESGVEHKRLADLKT